MARIRTIKPEFWTDEKLTECSLSARLLFIGTWNFADDAGNLDRSPKQIKARVFPLDNLDCEPLLIELIAQGLLTEYDVSGKKYLHINGFQKHQLINRPSLPVCPPMESGVVLTESPCATHDRREGKGGEGKGGEGKEGGCVDSEKSEKKPTARGSRLPPDWVLPLPWGEWALQEKPGWSRDDVRKCADRFRDFWVAKAGKDAVKLDWEATWRNWVRKEADRAKPGVAGSNHAAVSGWLKRDEGGQTIEGECHAAK